MALQFLTGELFAAAFTVKPYYYKIKAAVAKLFRPSDTASNPDVAADEEDATSL